MLIGSRAYSNLERTLGEQAVEGNLLLLGLRGSTARLQQKRLALNQKLDATPAGSGQHFVCRNRRRRQDRRAGQPGGGHGDA